jgi:predicted nucleotidyltransferase
MMSSGYRWVGDFCDLRLRNENTVVSDYDILIKISETLNIREKVTLGEKIKKILAYHKIDSDIIIKSEEEIQKQSKLHGHITQQI